MTSVSARDGGVLDTTGSLGPSGHRAHPEDRPDDIPDDVDTMGPLSMSTPPPETAATEFIE